MIKLNIHEAKTHLSKYLEQLQNGEVILLCKRNQPIAEIHPIRSPARKKRPLGIAEGQLVINPTFNDPASGRSIGAV